LRQIAENAGTSGAVVVRRVMESKDNQGYNALTGEYVDVIKAGHHHADQGRAHRAPERRRSRHPPAHHRLHHRRTAQEGRAATTTATTMITAAAWVAWAAWAAWTG
jgi:hypothetical protein